MKILREPLIAALLPLVALSSRKTTIPILGCIHADAKGGRLRLKASDLDMWQDAQIECDGKLEPICLPSSHFLELVKSSGERITMEEKAGWLHLDKSRIAGMPAVEFPPDPKDDLVEIGVNCADMADGIESVYFAAYRGGDDNKFILQSVFVKTSEKNIICIGASPVAIAIHTNLKIAAPCEFLFMEKHAKQIAEVMRLPNARLFVGKNYLRIQYENGALMAKQIEGKYPVEYIENMMKGERTHLGTLQIAPLLETLNGVNRLCPDTKCAATHLQASKDGLLVEHVNPCAEVSKALAGEFKDVSLMINARTFAQCLSAFGEQCDFGTIAGQVGPNIHLAHGDLEVLATQLKQ